MSSLYGGGDRAKASAHAIFLVRELPQSCGAIEQVLTSVADGLKGKLRFQLPPDLGVEAVPLELVVSPRTNLVTHRALELRVLTKTGFAQFFEGDLRLEDVAERSTQIEIVGRFTLPPFAHDLTGERATHFAEETVLHAFEVLLEEISARLKTRDLSS